MMIMEKGLSEENIPADYGMTPADVAQLQKDTTFFGMVGSGLEDAWKGITSSIPSIISNIFGQQKEESDTEQARLMSEYAKAMYGSSMMTADAQKTASAEKSKQTLYMMAGAVAVAGVLAVALKKR